MLLGLEPEAFLGEGDDADLTIRIAMLKKAWELRGEERQAELKTLATWLGVSFKE